jgi:hypothetical protein
MNDNDRADWINSDEGLYRWWKSEGGSLRSFIRKNRAELTRIINAAQNTQPGHSYVSSMADSSNNYRNSVTGIYRGF